MQVKSAEEEYHEYDYCEHWGLNCALFKARILKNVFQCGPLEAYSFFAGAVLHDEVKSLLNIELAGQNE